MRGIHILLALALLVLSACTGLERTTMPSEETAYLERVGPGQHMVVETGFELKQEGSYSVKGALYANESETRVYITGQDGTQTLFCFDEKDEAFPFVINSLVSQYETGDKQAFRARIRDSTKVEIGKYSCQISARSDKGVFETTPFEMNVVSS